MTFGPSFYAPFWTAFQATYPMLPTRDGLYLGNNDLTHNYIGHQVVAGPASGFCVSLVFKGNGAARPLVVEVYAPNGADPRWQALKPQLQKGHLIPFLPQMFPLVNIPVQDGAQADRVCWEVYGAITAPQADQNQAAVHAQLAVAYTALLARL